MVGAAPCAIPELDRSAARCGPGPNEHVKIVVLLAQDSIPGEAAGRSSFSKTPHRERGGTYSMQPAGNELVDWQSTPVNNPRVKIGLKHFISVVNLSG